MQLETGICYKDRVGRVVGPMEIDRDRVFPFKGVDEDGALHRYRPDGKWNNHGEDHGRDLIEIADAPVKIDPEVGTYEPKLLGFAQFLYADDGKPAPAWDDHAEPGYEPLAGVLREAHDQASAGKGKERHANGKPFTEQQIMEYPRRLGSPEGQLYQVMKKADEANGMFKRGEKEAAIRELLGAINYTAAAILLIREL